MTKKLRYFDPDAISTQIVIQSFDCSEEWRKKFFENIEYLIEENYDEDFKLKKD